MRYLVPVFEHVSSGAVHFSRPVSKNKKRSEKLAKDWRELQFDYATKTLVYPNGEERKWQWQAVQSKRPRGRPKTHITKRSVFFEEELNSVGYALAELGTTRHPIVTPAEWESFSRVARLRQGVIISAGPWYRLTAIAMDLRGTLDPRGPKAEAIAAAAIAASHRQYFAKMIDRFPVMVPLFVGLMRMEIRKINPLVLWLFGKEDYVHLSNDELVEAYCAEHPGRATTRDEIKKALKELSRRIKAGNAEK